MHIHKRHNYGKDDPAIRNNEEIIMLLLFFILYSPQVAAFGANVAVYNKNKIFCIADDNSTVFFDPPRIQDGINSTVLIEEDWVTKTSTLSHFGPVLDKRWEDFPVVHTSCMNFTFEHSLAFSIYKKEVNTSHVYLNNDDFRKKIDLDVNKYDQLWIHYLIILKNRDLYLYKDNNLVGRVSNFNPTTLEIVAENATYWKIHNYTWQFSDTASTSSQRINVTDTCLVLYASTCSHCSIEVFTSSGVNYSLSSNNTEPTWGWTSQKLLFGNSSDNYLNIFRKIDNNKKDGYWGLDIRQCPKKTKSGKVIFEKSLEEDLAEETFCLTLDKDHDSYTDQSESSQCDGEKLGREFDIDYKEILIDKLWENWKICYDRNCSCEERRYGKYYEEKQPYVRKSARKKRKIDEVYCQEENTIVENRLSNVNKKFIKKWLIVAGVIGIGVLLLLLLLLSCPLCHQKGKRIKKNGCEDQENFGNLLNAQGEAGETIMLRENVGDRYDEETR